MKLLKKYRIYTFTSLILAIIIGFISNYHLFKHTLFETADEVIQENRREIEEYAAEHHTLEPLLEMNSGFSHIIRVDSTCNLSRIDMSIKDTLAYDQYQREHIIFKKLIFPVETEDGKYIVRLLMPTLERDYLIGITLISLLIFTAIFILFTSLIDVLFTRKIFNPFYKILQIIKTYNIEERNNLKLEKNDIDEFQELNKILTEMMNKINNGYYEMKEFAEFTSHELQTPLSIIQLKLDSLNQYHFEDEKILQQLSSIQISLQKVIKFNRTILLIAKIRNGQFNDKEIINMKVLINNYFKQYEELFTMKNIAVNIKQDEDCNIMINPILADYLIQNIITNAIKHNCYGGNIDIATGPDRIVISNSFNGKIPEGNLFDKYNHSKERCDSNGLGLAMVKMICKKSKLNIDYKIEGHNFILTLSV